MGIVEAINLRAAFSKKSRSSLNLDDYWNRKSALNDADRFIQAFSAYSVSSHQHHNPTRPCRSSPARLAILDTILLGHDA